MIMEQTRIMHREDGFTLVEMMVAFALLGLVVTALYSFYFNGLQAWNRSLDRIEYQQTARISMDKMIRELQYAHLLKSTSSEGPETGGVNGDILYYRIDNNGIPTWKSFRLKDTQLNIDWRGDCINSISSTNLIALQVSGLEFFIDENDTVFITITAGAGPGKTVLNSAVRPRNVFPAEPEPQDHDPGAGEE